MDNVSPLHQVEDPPRKGTLEYKLEGMFAGISIGIMTTGDEHCATVMAQSARPLAKAWANLAKENERVRKVLEMLTTGGAYGEVIFVTASTVIPIAAHHGLLPDNMPLPMSFGVQVPDTPPPNGETGTGTVDASEGIDRTNAPENPEKPFRFGEGEHGEGT